MSLVLLRICIFFVLTVSNTNALCLFPPCHVDLPSHLSTPDRPTTASELAILDFTSPGTTDQSVAGHSVTGQLPTDQMPTAQASDWKLDKNQDPCDKKAIQSTVNQVKQLRAVLVTLPAPDFENQTLNDLGIPALRHMILQHVEEVLGKTEGQECGVQEGPFSEPLRPLLGWTKNETDDTVQMIEKLKTALKKKMASTFKGLAEDVAAGSLDAYLKEEMKDMTTAAGILQQIQFNFKSGQYEPRYVLHFRATVQNIMSLNNNIRNLNQISSLPQSRFSGKIFIKFFLDEVCQIRRNRECHFRSCNLDMLTERLKYLLRAQEAGYEWLKVMIIDQCQKEANNLEKKMNCLNGIMVKEIEKEQKSKLTDQRKIFEKELEEMEKMKSNCNCQPGKFIASQNSSVIVCKKCDIGYFSNTTGVSHCTSCPRGFVQNSEGATKCLLCGPGTFQEEADHVTCKPCPPGHASSEVGATNCHTCPSGTEPVLGKFCQPCPIGSFRDVVDETSNSTRREVEHLETDGSFLTETPECVPCPPGYFANATGGATCHACPQGYYQPANGTTTCIACEAGEYQDQEASKECAKCGTGEYTLGEGSVTCNDCSLPLKDKSHPAFEQCLGKEFNHLQRLVAMLICKSCASNEQCVKRKDNMVCECQDGFIRLGTGCFHGTALSPYQNSTYFIGPESQGWESAREFCTSAGGDLASFENGPEWVHVLAEIKRKDGGNAHWIGGKRESKTWKWVSGVRLSQSRNDWYRYSNRCLKSLQPNSYNQNWYNRDRCSSSSRYVCEFKK